MKRMMFSLALAMIATLAARADHPTPVQTVERATEVIAELEKIPLKGIPPKLLEDAKGVAIIPRVIKVGFVLGGRHGHGLVMTRNDKNEWSDPTFVEISGASVGFQAGVQSTDVVLVFHKKETLEKILAGNGKLTLVADAAVAAGPLGRQAAAATDGKLQAEIYSYSRSRGLFAGVSLDGAAILNDGDQTAKFKKDTSKETVQAVVDLKNKLAALSVEPPAKK